MVIITGQNYLVITYFITSGLDSDAWSM